MREGGTSDQGLPVGDRANMDTSGFVPSLQDEKKLDSEDEWGGGQSEQGLHFNI